MVKKKLFFGLGACLLIGLISIVILFVNPPVNPQPQSRDKPNPETTPTPTPSENPDGYNNTPSATPSNSGTSSNPSQPEPTVPINTDPPPGPHVNEVDHEVPSDYVWNSSEVIDVGLNGNSITISQPNVATVEGSKITITSAGTYRLSGSLTDGQVIVNTESKETVRLILNNLNIHCSNSAPIYIMKDKKTIIVLQQGTQNTITDGSSYNVNADGEPNAAIFSKSDLTIYGDATGDGALNVQAHYNDGIASKDGLIVKSGQITINAVDDGIRGKDYLVIRNGLLNINAGGDGLKSDDTEDVSRGYVTIENGVMHITADRDAIDVQTDFLMKNGQITAIAGGGSSNNVVEGTSTKGIKATVELVIEDGTFDIDSSDDAIHSNGPLTIYSGTFVLKTNDDGIHADGALVINNGVFNIPKCYEGLEASVITINGGNFHITSRDDGINVAGGNDGSGSGGDTFMRGSYHLYINGGYIYVNANGDGIDSNGDIIMTGGQVIVDGPVTNMESALDYDFPPPRGVGAFKMTGGFVLAVGSAGMAVGPDSSSTQYSVMLTFNTTKAAGTIVHLRTSSETEVFTFKPVKQYRSVVFCSPALTTGTYEVWTGGSSTGTPVDGLYSGGTYTPGNRAIPFTITSIVTKVGGTQFPFPF